MAHTNEDNELTDISSKLQPSSLAFTCLLGICLESTRLFESNIDQEFSHGVRDHLVAGLNTLGPSSIAFCCASVMCVKSTYSLITTYGSRRNTNDVAPVTRYRNSVDKTGDTTTVLTDPSSLAREAYTVRRQADNTSRCLAGECTQSLREHLRQTCTRKGIIALSKF